MWVLVIYCCITYDLTIHWLKTIINMYYFTVSVGLEFGSNLAGQFCSRSLVRLQSNSQLGLQSSEDLPGLEDLPRWLFVMAGKLVLVVGRKPQFLAAWVSP